MNFFQQLAMQTGGIDITMRIMQKNNTLTINIMPGSGSSTMQPILVTGTPAELDENFFSIIAPGIKEVTGLVTNIEEVKKELQQKADSKESDKAKPAAKAAKPAAKKEKKPKVVEGSLFQEEPSAEEEEDATEEQEEATATEAETEETNEA